jgi:UDP-GlcNAc:undecaprenyl-phosphate GlcNAc-1-phosphate transferase
MLAIAVIAAAVTTLVAAPMVRRLGLAIGAVDAPEPRKLNRYSTPGLGGLALAGGIAAGLGILGLAQGTGQPLFADRRWLGLLLGAGLLLAVGAFDDARPISAWAKLAAQIVAASVAVAFGFGATALANPFGGAPLTLGWLGPIVAAFWIVAAVNALNLIDGLDGLCVGVAAMAGAALAVVAALNGQAGAVVLLAVVAAASVGFLAHNVYPAAIFPGDSGSLMLGYLLGVGALWAVTDPATGAVAFAPALLALAVPLADTVTAVFRRLFQVMTVKRSSAAERERFDLEVSDRPHLFAADRNHVHHRLLDRGYPHRVAVVILWGLSAAAAAAAVAVVAWPSFAPLALAAAIGIAVYLVLFQLRYQELRPLQKGLLLPLFSRGVIARRSFHALVDAALAAIAFAAAFLLVHGLQVRDGAIELWAVLPVVAVVEIGGFYLSGLYRGAYRHAGVGEALRVIRSTVLAATAAAVGLALVFGFGWTELATYVINGLLLTILIVGSRVSFRVLDYVYEHGSDAGVPTLLYGCGRGGDLALRQILADHSLGWRPIGFIDDLPNQAGRYRCGYPILGGLDDLHAVLEEYEVHQIVVTTRKLRPDRLERLREIAAGSGISVARFSIDWEPLGPAKEGKEHGLEDPREGPQDPNRREAPTRSELTDSPANRTIQ